MKFLLLSDTHGTGKNPVGRKDDIMETFDRKFTYVLNYAEQHNLPILQAGDLTHSSRNWDMLSYLVRKLKDRTVAIYTVFGQHDMYLRKQPRQTPSIMQILMESNMLVPLGSKPTLLGNCNIYGANWGDNIPGIEHDLNTRKNILVLHAPVSLKEEYPGHDFTGPGYFLKKHPDFDLILVGDVHRMFTAVRKSRTIVNTGPMLRLEATEYNFKHKPSFFIWDSKTHSIKRHIIPHGKAENVLSREHLDEAKISRQELEAFTATLNKLGSATGMRKAKIKKYLKNNVKSKRVRAIVEEIINGPEKRDGHRHDKEEN